MASEATEAVKALNLPKIKIEYVPTADLEPYANNPRDNNQDAVNAAKESISRFGWLVPVVIDKRNCIAAGHTRILAAKALGIQEIPCVRAEHLTDAQVRAYRVADNKITELSKWVKDKLVFEIEELPEFDFSLFGFDLDKLLKPGKGKTDPDAVPDTPVKAKSKPGTIYQLGKNRLMCASSTEAANLARLMDGKEADCWITDPPYNVDYKGAAGKIENDNQDDASFRAFLRDAYAAADGVMRPGAAFYIWHASSESYNFTGACRDVGWKHRQTIEWVKNALVLGRQDYQWRHEPCLYGWKEGAGHYFVAERHHTTVIEDAEPDIDAMTQDELKERLRAVYALPSTIIREDKPPKNDMHPTMKPVKLLTHLIKNSTKRGQLILDSFLGSGSTLIAAQQNDRVCYGLELDPKFADVIRKRWAEFVHGAGCDWEALTPEVQG